MPGQFQRAFLSITAIATLFLSSPLVAADSSKNWAHWFMHQVSQHSDIVAARESMNARLSFAKGREKPLYNPDLDMEFEQEGPANNYRIGLSQTVDIWNKRDSRKTQSVYTKKAAQEQFALLVLEHQAETLRALVQWQNAEKLADLAQAEEAQLESLIHQVRQRQKTGDMNELDAELTVLSLAEKLNSLAQAQSALMVARARINELLPGWSPSQAEIPDIFWPVDQSDIPAQPDTLWVDRYPEVVVAKAQWQEAQVAAELMRKEAKAEPSIGINGGKNGDEDVVGLTFSMPLNVRNNFGEDVKAARQEALAAEAQYRSLRNRRIATIQASLGNLQAYQAHYRQWQALIGKRKADSLALLKKMFQAGDLSASEYLLALQQRLDGLSAGIDLETQFHLAYLDWLTQSGTLPLRLNQLSNSTL